MLPKTSIKALYTLALAEGEGVGTAYEYYAKRLVLGPWLAERPRPARMLIAGLPQKYGSSLDLLQLAVDLQAEVVVADERPEALTKLERGLVAVRAQGWLSDVVPRLQLVDDMGTLTGVAGAYDLALSCEALQRMDVATRRALAARLHGLAGAVALFAPNEDNPAHTAISGLDGLTLAEIRALVPAGGRLLRSGYIDMPPFPPGIVRSEDQRAQASSGRLEAAAMWGLQTVARLERFLPGGIRRRQSHIVYALSAGVAIS